MPVPFFLTNEQERRWVAAIDWSALRHASEERAPDAHRSSRTDPLLPDGRRLSQGTGYLFGSWNFISPQGKTAWWIQ